MSSIPTTEKLAMVLEAELRKTTDPQKRARLVAMIPKARAGFYDDFKSPLATPCIQLHADLMEAGCAALAKRHVDGEWDATKEESDAWAASPDGQAVINSLVKDPAMRKKMGGR